eukprot:361871-Chlamydomonas_euryale.AAC.5
MDPLARAPHLDRAGRAEHIEDGVGAVHGVVDAAQQHEQPRVRADRVDHKHIAAPRGHHVGVRGSGGKRPGP